MKATVILTTILLAFAAAVVRADVPRTIDHQGYLTTDAGEPVTGTRSMVFTIYDVAGAGTALWTETQSVTVADGLFNVFLGDVTPLPDSIFNGQPLFLGVRIGTDSEMTPRIRLTTVPYAFASGHDSWPARRWFRDADQDSFGNRYVWVPAVGRPAGYVADSTDCNDGNAAIHPGAAETCDGVDSDCNLADGYPETCNGLDDDCSGTADDNLIGPPCPLEWGVCSGARMICGGTSGWLACGSESYGPYYEPVEVSCDGLDNDCDGEVDEVSCDDGVPCTIDRCDMGCTHELADGVCLIGGVCYEHGQANPANECQVCDVTQATLTWSPRPDNTTCSGGTCQGGICTPP
jgi:hypothetical protein